MCYDDNARPPVPPGEAGQAHGDNIVLTSADGSSFAAYKAMPAQISSNGAQILIYPDIRGLHQFYKELALRFAEIGITAIAMDYFGRTASLAPRDEDFDFWPHVQKIDASNVFADARASIAEFDATKPTFVVGFCLGGSLSILTSTQEIGLTGAIGFYAGLSRQMSGSAGTVLDESVKARIPFLGLFGGDDQNITADQINKLDENLDAAGVEHQTITYQGAPHSFFDRRSAEYADASNDAWTRILDFIQQQSA